MGLHEEIDSRRRTIKTDGYAMSVGELVSLYRDGELDLHPEFQRLFRWTDLQKARLIESLLLTIPIPSIFVSQRDDGVWDVIDGLQRLSTILQFMGELKGPDDIVLEPLRLVSTDYLPSLGGTVWDATHGDRPFTPEQQLLIKRAKIDIRIMLRESDPQSKYDLFDRLNTGGSILSDQELRNSLIASLDPPFLTWMTELSTADSFRACLTLSERQELESFDMELVTRFLCLRGATDQDLRAIGDLGTFLTKSTVERIQLRSSMEFDLQKEKEAFLTTFEYIESALSSDAFRRYDARQDRFMGGFSVSAFEFVALGIGHHSAAYGRKAPPPDTAVKGAKYFWSDQISEESSDQELAHPREFQKQSAPVVGTSSSRNSVR